MKKLAVIGCSHSNTKLARGKPWSWYLAHHFPNVEIYNYSQPGSSALWADIILKYILFEKKYDGIILQMTYPTRWFVPVKYKNKDHNVFFDIGSGFELEKDTEIKNFNTIKDSHLYFDCHPNDQNFQSDNMQYVPLGYSYKAWEYLYNMLPYYEKSFNTKIFSWVWWLDEEYWQGEQWHGNMGLLPFCEWRRDGILDEGNNKEYTWFPEDPFHYNHKGHQILCDEYILSSKNFREWMKS